MREHLERKKGSGRKIFRAEPALSYAPLRRAWLDALVLQFGQQRTIPFRTPVDHSVVFIEPDRHRDKDGVYMGGMKLVWDALVKAGLLPNDTAENIGCCRGWDVVVAHRARCGFLLGLWEAGETDMVTLSFRGILPDLNELLAARELGARRGVRLGL